MGFKDLKRLMALTFAALFAMALFGCSPSQAQDVAARFGDHVITEAEVADYTAGYRAQNGLGDDEEWKSFVLSRYADTKSWREEAIRVLADEVLVREKAEELGITVDESRVSQAISDEKEKAGVAEGDEQAWSDYLAESGQTPQGYREKLEYSSIEEQVYRSELDFTDELESEMCTDYIRRNYSDQVMHHYWAIPFDLADREGARALLDELKGLEGDQLRERFVAAYGQAAVGDEAASGYDIGWDFLYAEGRIDPDIDLRNANLSAGSLYDGVLEGTDALRVVMCDERIELVDPDFDSIESESFKRIIRAYTLATTWASKCNSYLSELEEQADIQVAEMPSGLAYAIEG